MRIYVLVISFVIVSLAVCFAEDPTIPEHKECKEQRRIKKDGIYNDTLQVIRSTSELYLIFISQSIWLEMKCHCLKSTFIETTTGGARRCVYCYKYLHLPKPLNPGSRTTRKEKPLNPESRTMRKESQEVTFSAKKEGGATFVFLTPTEPPLLFDLEPRYRVLAATPDCLLLKVRAGSKGKAHCMLWAVGGDHDKNDQACFDAMDKECTSMTDVWLLSDDCIAQDDLDKGIQPSNPPPREGEPGQVVPPND